MTRIQVEAVAKVLWLQALDSNVEPFPEAGAKRELFMKRAREVIYAFQGVRSAQQRPAVGHYTRMREAKD